jgi:hypothetical protein
MSSYEVKPIKSKTSLKSSLEQLRGKMQTKTEKNKSMEKKSRKTFSLECLLILLILL